MDRPTWMRGRRPVPRISQRAPRPSPEMGGLPPPGGRWNGSRRRDFPPRARHSRPRGPCPPPAKQGLALVSQASMAGPVVPAPGAPFGTSPRRGTAPKSRPGLRLPPLRRGRRAPARLRMGVGVSRPRHRGTVPFRREGGLHGAPFPERPAAGRRAGFRCDRDRRLDLPPALDAALVRQDPPEQVGQDLGLLQEGVVAGVSGQRVVARDPSGAAYGVRQDVDLVRRE